MLRSIRALDDGTSRRRYRRIYAQIRRLKPDGSVTVVGEKAFEEAGVACLIHDRLRMMVDTTSEDCELSHFGYTAELPAGSETFAAKGIYTYNTHVLLGRRVFSAEMFVDVLEAYSLTPAVCSSVQINTATVINAVVWLDVEPRGVH